MEIDLKLWDSEQLRRGASFLQSRQWGRFQESIGNHPHYFMEESWSCLLLERRTRMGKYMFAPYGPTMSSPEKLEKAIAGLKNYSSRQGAGWLRIEPWSSGGTDELKRQLERLGAVPAFRKVNPDLTLVLDLTPPEDELLASISQSTRSFIRKNQREKFLNFKTSGDPADINVFTKMLGAVAHRNKVNFFTEDEFKKQAERLMPAGMMFLELAMDGDKPIASAVIHDFGQTSSYTYAASLPEARKTSASALLLWQAMLNSKSRKNKLMDLFGIAPPDAPPSHPWQGFTSFKRKFGGRQEQRSGTWDIPLTAGYRLYRQAQKTRALLRRR